MAAVAWVIVHLGLANVLGRTRGTRYRSPAAPAPEPRPLTGWADALANLAWLVGIAAVAALVIAWNTYTN